MAVSEQTLDHQPALHREGSRRVPRPGRRFLLFVMTALLGSATVVGGLAALHEREAGRILTGVSAAGIDLGGMTGDEARSALTARLIDLSAGSITIRSGIGTTTIAFADVGRLPDIDAMVADAAARGRGGSWFDESVAGLRLRLEPEAIGLRLGYDHDMAAAAVARFLGRTALNPIDATVIRGTSAFAATGSVEGRRIDEAATIAAVDQVMRDPASRAGIVIDAPVVRIA
ncbi:MAG TPA: peptidoglycan binding domain-containing protein, partial [Candidatus Deferrimicrobium sp.]|nr:peptidoglycan binding domain-containing protein [Candidatus Deferrimicrobium sp.]